MNKLTAYFRESYTELVTKVSWPTWDELMNSAIVVATAALVMAAFVWVMDEASRLVLETFYKSF
ncbi:MAG TPA: preprotein translocase subunit SecE [Bacteroidetes bacterium]|nr:preprotein translocase subunit SecE [Bacteroidota bacterium]